jgi:hypothetical protein
MAYLRASLAAAGHPVGFSRGPGKTGINILIDAFGDGLFEEAISDAARAGATNILVATENIGPEGYWPGTNTPFDGGRERFDNLLRVAESISAFWCLSAEQEGQYKKTFGTDRAFHYPHGYVENFEQFFWIEEKERDIDFFFSGRINDYRGRILAKLSAAGFTCLALPGDSRSLVRADAVAHSKVCLALRQSPTWPLPSITRLHYHLMAKSYVVAEECECPSDLDAYVEMAAPDELVEICIESVMSGEAVQRGIENHERFREECRIEAKVADIIAASVP